MDIWVASSFCELFVNNAAMNKYLLETLLSIHFVYIPQSGTTESYVMWVNLFYALVCVVSGHFVGIF